MMSPLPFVLALWAPPSDPIAGAQDRRVWLAVSAEVGEDTDALFAKQIRAAGDEAIRGAGWAVDVAARRRIQVEVEATGAEGYGLQYSLVSPGAEPQALKRNECSRCGSDEVIALVRSDLVEVVGHLRAEPVVAAEMAGPRPSDLPPPRSASEPTSTSRGRLGPLGQAGIGTMAPGLAAVCVGVALVVLKEKDSPQGELVKQTDYRTPGAIVLGVGAAAVVAGIAMLAIDRHRSRSRHVRTSAWGGLHRAGVSLTVRW